MSKRTFASQDSLPLLPIPDLASTIRKYLETVKPFISDNDMLRTKAIAEDFLNGTGAELQQRLLKHKEEVERSSITWRPTYYACDELIHKPLLEDSAGKKSWLINWWNDYSYLKYRESVVLNVSFFFGFDDIFHLSGVERAALTIYYALEFKYLVVNENLDVDRIRNVPMCMAQYHYLFNSCRIPYKPKDYVELYDPKQHQYFCIAYRGNYYQVSEMAQDGSIVGVEALQEMLKGWLDKEHTHGTDTVGVLSAGHRDAWAEDYIKLIGFAPDNLKHLRIIQSSSFLLCIDDSCPLSREEMAHLLWHNYGQNRWFDKTLQFVVFANGRAGFLGEHSMVDATTPSRLCEYILERTKCYKFGEMVKQPFLPEPVHLPLAISAELQESIRKITDELQQAIGHHQLKILHYRRYGKDFIKSLRMSPDSYVQMAIQYAYFLLTGENCATYESAGMKRYQWGRTETCRSVSEQSNALCHAMRDKAISCSAKSQRFRAAVDAHSNYMSECLQGNGIDRHLLGLRLCLKPDEPMPSFFLDPAYNLSCHWTLSTSQIPSDYLQLYGWGEVVPDGFGVAYMVREDKLMFNVAGLVGDAVPSFSPHNLKEQEYFTRNYKFERVDWLHSCIETSLDEIYEMMSNISEQDDTQEISNDLAKDQPVAKLSTIQTSPPILERSRSINSLPAHLGLSLAYPRRSEASRMYSSEASGVVGDDVGLIDFEIAWGTTSSIKTHSRQASRRIMRFFNWKNRSEK